MYRNLLSLLRISAGLALLMLGLIGLFVPILQGWLLIFLAIPLISPEHGRRMIAKIKEWKEKILLRWRREKTETGETY